jgi:hypothetical protein
LSPAAFATFGVVVHAPLTAPTIAIDMTSNPAMTVPVDIAAILGTLASRVVCEAPVYAAMSHQFLLVVAPTGRVELEAVEVVSHILLRCRLTMRSPRSGGRGEYVTASQEDMPSTSHERRSFDRSLHAPHLWATDFGFMEPFQANAASRVSGSGGQRINLLLDDRMNHH